MCCANDDLSESDGSDILAIGGCAIARAHQPRQEAAQALHTDAPIDGVVWRRRRTCDALIQYIT